MLLLPPLAERAHGLRNLGLKGQYIRNQRAFDLGGGRSLKGRAEMGLKPSGNAGVMGWDRAS